MRLVEMLLVYLVVHNERISDSQLEHWSQRPTFELTPAYDLEVGHHYFVYSE
jgi:hypothetical protein